MFFEEDSNNNDIVPSEAHLSQEGEKVSESSKNGKSSFKWYILNVYSGYEHKVAEAIKEDAKKKSLDNFIKEIIVPVRGIVEYKKGKKVNAEEKIFPGYILVNAIMNDDTWHLIKSIPRVAGFLGSRGSPQPISVADVERVRQQIIESIASPKSTIVFEVGESVKINEGPFASFVGVIEEVDDEKSRLKVAVTIFGRSTPVDLEFSQVEKL